MATAGFPFQLARQTGRVPSMTVPLDREQERRFDRLMDTLVMIDLHEHPMVLPEDMNDLEPYCRGDRYTWGYEAVRHGGWTAVCTANILSCLGKTGEPSFAEFSDLLEEISLMLADVAKHGDGVVQIRRTADIVDAKQRGVIGFLPTVEHLAIGHELHRVDVLYGLGVRLAGLTYTRKSFIGDGQTERTDCGLSEFGVEVVRRMNDLGMVIDLSHAGTRTALDAIEISQAPCIFSHNAAHAIWPTKRTRKDEELLACARKGGLIAITAVPNSLSDDPKQDINCVLDHYDYAVRLVGPEHVAIGTDTLIGDHVGLHVKLLGRDKPHHLPAPYLDGLESPADGRNIIRGLIARGYSNDDITRIAGANALELFQRVMG